MLIYALLAIYLYYCEHLLCVYDNTANGSVIENFDFPKSNYSILARIVYNFDLKQRKSEEILILMQVLLTVIFQ